MPMSLSKAKTFEIMEKESTSESDDDQNIPDIETIKSCGSYQDFPHRGLLIARKILHQVLLLVNLKSPLRKFYGRHHDLVDRYGISVSQMTTDMFHLS
jgi:hypothetical protein